MLRKKLLIYSPVFSNTKSYYQLLDLAFEYGLGGVELLNLYELKNADLNAAKEIALYAAKRNLKIPCLSVGINLVGADREEKIKELQKYVQIASEIGADYLHHTIAVNLSNTEETLKNFDSFMKHGLDAVMRIRDYAKNLGVEVIYEDQGFIFNGIENLEYFIKNSDSSIKLIGDVGNILFADETPENYLNAFKDRIVHMHLKDYIKTSQKSEDVSIKTYTTIKGNYLKDVAIGKGSLNYDAIGSIMKSSSYNGYYAIETCVLSNPKELENTISFLEKTF